MHNSTPSAALSDEQARAAAEAALKERGWNPVSPHHWWEGELAVGRSTDGENEISIWDGMDGRRDGVPWLCDVGAADSGEKKSLWVVGIPRPEEVPALLERHADILSVGHGEHTLDLATSEVLDSEETRRRLGVATFAERIAEADAERERKIAPIRETLETAWRKLAEGYWETYEPVYSFGRVLDDMRRTVEIMAVPYCRQDDGSLLLDLTAYYDDTRRGGGDGDVWLLDGHGLASTGIPVEYFGRARVVLPLPGGPEEIPTPREAMRLMKGVQR